MNVFALIMELLALLCYIAAAVSYRTTPRCFMLLALGLAFDVMPELIAAARSVL